MSDGFLEEDEGVYERDENGNWVQKVKFNKPLIPRKGDIVWIRGLNYIIKQVKKNGDVVLEKY